MLSISTLHSFEYYVSEGLKETFSYYSGRGENGDERERDPAGKWVGKYADRLGLPAHAKIEDFAALYFGFDPNTGKPLTKSADQTGWQLFKVKQLLADENLTGPKRLRLERRARKLSAEIAGRDKNSASSKKGNGAKGDDEEVAKPRKKSVHRPGVDLTFTPPKDFSLLLAASSPADRKRLLAIYREAVEETLESVEREFAQTRIVINKPEAEGGKVVVAEKTKGLAILMFEHLGARPVGDNAPDPDGHFHCLVMSPVLCQDEKTRALFSDRIKRNIKALGAESRARLALKLAEREGIEVVPDEQKRITSFRLSGVDAKDRVFFSKRRGQIEALMAQSGEKAGLSTLKTRETKGDWDRQDLIDDWKGTMAQRGMSRERMLAPDAKAKGWTARTDEQIVAALQDMKVYFSVPELRQSLWEEAQFIRPPEGQTLSTWIDGRLNAILKNPDLLRIELPEDSIEQRSVRGQNADHEPIFTTKSLILREIALDKALGVLGGSNKHAIPWEVALTHVEALEVRKTADSKDKWSYRDDQRAAIGQVLFGADICFVQAFAGTGKTTAAAAMFEVWKSEGKKVFGLAPSNKATGQLADDCDLTKSEAMTVAKFLYDVEKGKLKAKDIANSIIFIDEASMVGFDDAEKLIELSLANKCKIVFQGDSEQLPSVPKGRFFANAVEQRLGSAAAELTVITRQREQWAAAATEAAAKGLFAEALEAYDQRGLIKAEGSDENLYDRIVEAHLADKNDFKDKIIVASRNSDVDAINARIRLSLVKRGRVDTGHELFSTVDGREKPMMVGARDRIVFCAKAEGDGATANNGDLATVLSVGRRDDDSLDVKVRLDRTGTEFSFNTAEFSGIDHAYAITVHKSQGATVNSCRYLFSDFVSSELAYVGMSRHRDSLEIFVRADRKDSMAGMMGKKIEKFSARDLADNATLAELNREAQGLYEKAVAGKAQSLEKMPAIAQAAASARQSISPTRQPPVSQPAASLDGLVATIEELSDHMSLIAHELAEAEHARQMTADAKRRAAENESKAAAARAAEAAAQEAARRNAQATIEARQARRIEEVGKAVGRLSEKDRIDLACHLAGIPNPKAAGMFNETEFRRDMKEAALFGAVGKVYTAETDSQGVPNGFLRVYETTSARLLTAAADSMARNLNPILAWGQERDAARAGNVADISGLRREMADEMVKLKLNNPPKSKTDAIGMAIHIRDIDPGPDGTISIKPRYFSANWVVASHKAGWVAIPRAELEKFGKKAEHLMRGVSLPLERLPGGTGVADPSSGRTLGAGNSLIPTLTPKEIER
jgi:conjugative relaxase-like TrwC/TraI family protein